MNYSQDEESNYLLQSVTKQHNVFIFLSVKRHKDII